MKLETTATQQLQIRPWCFTALTAAAVYASNPLHRLAGGDSGELMAEACVGGVAHPPGYPLLLALMQFAYWATRKLEVLLLSMLPLQHSDVQAVQGSVPFVYVANTLNALFAVGAAACVTHVVDIWAQRAYPVEAIAAGLMFATSTLVWEYAVGLEVFALNNLLAGALHVLVLRHFLHPSARNAFAGAFVCGLGLANQHTLLLFEVPFVASVLATGRLSIKETIGCAFWFLMGASIYVHTLLSAQHATPGSWGDTSTLAGLWKHVLRREYGTFRLSPLEDANSERLLERLWLYAVDTVSEFNYAGIVFACIGAAHQVTQALSRTESVSGAASRGYSRSLLAAMACYLLVFHSLANIPLRDPLARAVSSRFAMQPNTVVAIWLGVGLVLCTKWLAAHTRSTRLVQCVRFATVSAMLSYQLATNYHVYPPLAGAYEQHSDMIRAYGETLLHALPRDALLLSYTDINWNTVRYLQLCEHQRPDVTHLSLQLMPFTWFPRQHKLYSRARQSHTASRDIGVVRFPVISRADVSTVRTSVGYAKYLDAFLLANLPQFSQRLFLDLHAVSDSDIGDSGRFRNVLLTPHGALWQVHAASEASNLFERWERASAAENVAATSTPSMLAHTSNADRLTVFAEGSWEFAARTITNDGAYQAALFRLGHWLGKANSITDMETLGAFVHAMRGVVAALEAAVHASQITSILKTNTSSSNSDVLIPGATPTGALSYPAYDVRKNAAVARMRFQTGLEVLASLQNTANWRHAVSSSPALQELADDVLPHVHSLREQAVETVRAILPAMRARSDAHVVVFVDFLNAHTAEDARDVAVEHPRGSFAASSGRDAAHASGATAKKKTKTTKKRKRRVKTPHSVPQSA